MTDSPGAGQAGAAEAGAGYGVDARGRAIQAEIRSQAIKAEIEAFDRRVPRVARANTPRCIERVF
jgi:hypothetical protein